MKYGWLLFALLVMPFAKAQKHKIFLLEIKQEIDPRMSRYVRLGLESARKQQADVVLIEMNTYGGMLKDADSIRTNLLNFEKPVWVLINKNAASAGALISLACDSIYMADGASIGAATVVNGADGRKLDEKYQSYMRSMMRSTAEANKRNTSIAERMVEGSSFSDNIAQRDKVITFTTSEAIKHGFCEGKANSIEEVLALNNITQYDIIRYELSLTEKIISFFLNPYVSSLLIMIIIGGIVLEMKAPGTILPLLASVVATLFYFVPYYLNGLAENWEIVAFLVGLILIALEVFVLPGFGVAGILGVVMTLGSLALMMLNNNFFDFSNVNDAQVTDALIVVLSSVFCGMIFILIVANRLGKEGGLKGISLVQTLDTKAGYSAKFVDKMLVGRTGIAQTVMRPSGKIRIGDEIYDATSVTGFVEQGKTITVVSQEGDFIKVKPLE